ncbi:hypothetical protein DH2020_004682 [Rehmannia glutinosa]|uniref:Major facilitator superfamily (MFS) profile domain-containing protein n=1 Tax=Rehmannia glutinosa TaxID=99300 RepID=A0ABR0XQ35_REHGL
MGFFTDAYDLFCISLVTKLLGRIYYHHENALKPGTLPPNVSAAVNGVAFCGTLAGQLFFGWLGDKLGRKKVYGMTLMVMVICSVASGLSFSDKPKAVMATLCFFRFWLGFGIGGDYPLSATIMSEYANKKTRGAFIAAVFAMQGFGILAGGMVAIIISAAFKSAFPARLTKITLSRRPSPKRTTSNAKQAASDMSKVLQVEIEAEHEKIEKIVIEKGNDFGLFSKRFLKRHGLHLLGTTSTWFLLDIAAQTLIALCSTVPGYWFTVALIDRIGRFAIQLMGFFFMTVFMFALAIPYNHWTHRENRIGFVIMSACHGISAAAGKAGAMVGAFGFLYAAQPKDPSKRDAGYPAGIGVKNSLIVLGCINALGMVFTMLVPESKGRSLEEMSGENEDENGESEMRPQGSRDFRTVPV